MSFYFFSYSPKCLQAYPPFFCFSFIQQFLLWCLLLCLLILLLGPKFSCLISREGPCSQEHGASSVSHPTCKLWQKCYEELQICPWHGSDEAHSSKEFIIARYEQWSLFCIKLVPWFCPSCFQPLDYLRRWCLRYAYHFFFNRRRRRPGWKCGWRTMLSQAISLPCD